MRAIQRIAWIAVAIPFVATAQIRPAAVSYFESSINGVIAQFVDGGFWKTIVTLVNLDTSKGTYTLYFYADDGSPMSIQTTVGTGTSVTGTLPVGGSVVIETPGTKATLSQGWALLVTSNGIGGSAIFRQVIPGQPAFEASLPIVIYVNANSYTLPFDNVTATTGVAIVNPLSYTSMMTFVTFRDEQGVQFLVDAFTLGPLAHTAFDLSVRYPQSVGKRGVAQFATANLALGILGIRFGAQSFTSILPLARLF